MVVGEVQLTVSLNWFDVPSNARTRVRPFNEGGAIMLRTDGRRGNANSDSGEETRCAGKRSRTFEVVLSDRSGCITSFLKALRVFLGPGWKQACICPPPLRGGLSVHVYTC